MKHKIWVVFLVFFMPWQLFAGTETPLYVGILESINNVFTKEHQPNITIAFQKKENRWVTMNVGAEDYLDVNGYYPKGILWTVVFDGKNMGSIKSQPLNFLKYAAERKPEIVLNEKNIPQVKLASKHFLYWTGPFYSRPLILVNAPNFNDPEKWKPSELFDNEKKIVITKFRKIWPTRVAPMIDGSGKKVKYSDKDIIISDSYRSKDGILLTNVRVNPELDKGADYPTWGDEYSGNYFVIFPDKTIKNLGSGMEAIDAVDLDKSGKSEWIFHRLSEGRDSYLIFYDNFSKSDDFTSYYN